jgi:uncharacterized protein YndB with AHSA1/START domain
MELQEMAVRRELILPVDREVVWQVLSDPAELAGWLADQVELRIAPGESGWLRWEGGEVRRAYVEEVVPERRVVLRWSAPQDEAGPETIVELALDDVPAGTRLVVLELPVARLQAVGQLLEQGVQVSHGPQMRAPGGPRMVGALA